VIEPNFEANILEMNIANNNIANNNNNNNARYNKTEQPTTVTSIITKFLINFKIKLTL
jgi:hypothetical protein